MAPRPLKTASILAAALLAGGLAAVAVYVDRAASSPALKEELEEQASAWLGRPLTIGSLDWRRRTRELVAHDVKLYDDAAKTALFAEAPEVVAKLTVLSALRLTAGVSELTVIRPVFKPRKGPDGTWDVARLAEEIEARPRGPARRLGRLVFSRFEVRDGLVEPRLPGSKDRLPALELSGVFTPPASSSFTISARGPGTDLRVRGTYAGRVLKLDARSRRADEAVLVGWAKAFSAAGKGGSASSKAAASAAPGWRLAAVLSADEVHWGRADLRDLRATVNRTTGPFTVDRVAFQSLSGTITARGTYVPEGPDAGLSADWKTTGIRARDLFRLAGSSREAEGTVNSEGTITAGLSERFLPDMNGTVTLDLRDGSIDDLPAVVKVVERLNVATFLRKLTGKGAKRIPFDEARGTLKIVNGKASTEEPFVLRNKTLQMAFMGSFDLPTRVFDARVAVDFLMVTDELVRLIPGVRDVLLGGDKSMVPVWLRITGPASHPNVDVLSGKSIAAPFWNSLKRLVRMPEKLVQKLKGK